MGRARGLRWCGYLLLGVLAIVRPMPASAADIDEARTLFNDGSAQFQSNRFEAALALLERSYALVPSPNTKLLIARCHRELGRHVEAAYAFAEAETTARKQIAQGETKYTTTAEVAAKEGARVRAELGSIKIHVSKADAKTTLSVDGQPVALDPAGEATVLHEPGSVAVDVRDASGQKQTQTVNVTAGADHALHFVAREAASAPPAPPPPIVSGMRRDAPPPTTTVTGDHGVSWTAPAAWISGGVAAVGLGMFIGFGVSSQNTYDNLVERCGPAQCGPSDRAVADRGAREQAIANISLAVAAVATAATVVFVILNMSSNAPASSARGGL